VCPTRFPVGSFGEIHSPKPVATRLLGEGALGSISPNSVRASRALQRFHRKHTHTHTHTPFKYAFFIWRMNIFTQHALISKMLADK
jgi:hypothetical protein